MNVPNEHMTHAGSVRPQQAQQRLGLGHADRIEMARTDGKRRMVLKYDDRPVASFGKLLLQPGEPLVAHMPADAAGFVRIEK